MDCRDKVSEMDARAIIRMNSIVELKYFLMALIYHHWYGQINVEDKEEE